MAAQERPRRAIAGANMAKLLLQEEDADDFYKTAYGGFSDLESDHEYKTENDQSDVVDTDFDHTEASDNQAVSSNDEHKKKRKVWAIDNTAKPKKEDNLKPKSDKPKVKRERPKYEPVLLTTSRRSTTTVKSEMSRIKRNHEEAIKPKRKSTKKEWVMPTQEEILEEAKETEEKNLALLDAFRRKEEDKKKTKATKRLQLGPFIRYHSMATPVTVLKVGGIQNSPQNSEHKITTRYCTRNFISFSDYRTMPSCLQRSKPISPPDKLYCPVTRLPAKYTDPITQTPYATAKAFKTIRESYAAYEDMRQDEPVQGKRSRKKATEEMSA